MNSSKMKLTADVLRSFKVSKVFREHKEKVNSIDYSFNGETMVSSSNDDTMIVYCCMEGKPRRYVNSKKYGCDLVRCTHSPNAVLCTSNKVDDTIRYLSLHDNKYLRYFPGHTKKVVSLQVSPVNDMFISCSLDKTVRLWDLRSNNCQGIMHLNGRPVAGFDPEGLIFAAGIDSRMLKLYDLKSFDKGPFATFNIRLDMHGIEWTGVKFSSDGKCILLSTNANQIILIDAFSGNELHRLTGYRNIKGLPLEASFTPDSQFVLSGSDDGMVYVWSVDSGEKVATLDGGHPGPTTSVQFNPRFMTLASACTNVGFWLPGADE